MFKADCDHIVTGLAGCGCRITNILIRCPVCMGVRDGTRFDDHVRTAHSLRSDERDQERLALPRRHRVEILRYMPAFCVGEEWEAVWSDLRRPLRMLSAGEQCELDNTALTQLREKNSEAF